MNEDDNEIQGGLGDIPDDRLDERKELPYRRAQAGRGVLDGRQASRSKMVNGEQIKEDSQAAGIMGPIEAKRNVQSVFDVRPVGTVDTLFGSTIELRVPA